MKGALLGPSFDDARVDEVLRGLGAVAHAPDPAALLEETAALLAAGDVVGWFQGRMEYGPRALGNRSILGDPRDPTMQSRMNLKIKLRESFRPFAPAVPVERAREHFALEVESPYMLLVAGPAPGRPTALPAVTHVDGSARVQTVSAATNPRFHGLLAAFERRTGCPVLVNTSFNIKDEPVVCTPEDAYRCFMRTGIEHLVIGGRILHKREQPPLDAAPRARSAPQGAAGERARLAGAARAAFAALRRAWMTLGAVLGWVNVRLVFGAVHLAVIVPYGLALRLLGRAPVALELDRGAPSYRKEARQAPPSAMERPF
jgi:hypothetical protein